MASTQAPIVKIERGKFSHHFQLVRAMLSAASASLNHDTKSAVNYIDEAMLQLARMRLDLVGE